MLQQELVKVRIIELLELLQLTRIKPTYVIFSQASPFSVQGGQGVNLPKRSLVTCDKDIYDRLLRFIRYSSGFKPPSYRGVPTKKLPSEITASRIALPVRKTPSICYQIQVPSLRITGEILPSQCIA